MTYRLYLRSGERIVCRHDFLAAGDDAAHRLATLLAEAASDVCDTFDLWQGARIVAGPQPGRRRLDAAVPGDLKATLVEVAEILLQGAWPVAQSERLAARLAAWRPRPDASLLERLLREVLVATGAHRGNIQLRDDAGNLHIVAQHGFGQEFLDYFAVVNDDDTSCGVALKKADRVIVEDVATSPIFCGKPSGEMLLRAGLRSTYSIPLMMRGLLRGMLSTHRTITWRPDAAELRTVDRFALDAAGLIG